MGPWPAFCFFGTRMQFAERIEELITPTVEALGFVLVRVVFTGGDNPSLQVMAEDAETGDMVVEDCVKVSRAISAVLDVEDPIDSNYNLEVSSPGIDRPLVREQDFKRFAGFEARIDTRAPVGGSKRFNGRLLGIKEGIVTINVEGEDVELAFPEINKAKLLLTDELIAAFEGQRKQ